MTSRKPIDVRLIKSSLVATFADANPPLIWRFDLERNHSFTLAMQGDDHEWELGVTSVKGEFHPVVRFAARDDAEEAFAAVSAALAHKKGGRLRSFLKITGIILILVLGTLMAMTVMRSSSVPVDPAVEQESYVAPPAVAPAPESPAQGVPVPADQVLKPPAP